MEKYSDNVLMPLLYCIVKAEFAINTMMIVYTGVELIVYECLTLSFLFCVVLLRQHLIQSFPA